MRVVAVGFVLAQLLIAPTSLVASPVCSFPKHHSTQIGTDDRPAAAQSLRSATLPIVMHYPDTVTNEYAQLALQNVEFTWRRLVNELGFLAPLPDDNMGGGSEFDVYITRDLAEGVGGYAGFSGFYDPTERSDAFGYLVIGADLKDHVLKFVVAHEFFHGIQMAYDWWEDIAYMEASANWATELVYDDLNVYWKFIPYFQAEPHLALDFVSIKNPYQYGMMLWPMFLEERLGNRDGSILRRVWEGTVQNEMNNEPDFEDAISVIASEKGFNSIDDVLAEFSLWRLLLGKYKDFGFFKERILWEDTVTPRFEVDATLADLPISRDATQALQPQSSGFLRVVRAEGSPFSIQLTFEKATNYSVRILRSTGGEIRQLAFSKQQDSQSYASTVEAGVGADQVFIVISHSGEAGYDPDTSQWTPNPWKVDMH